MFVHMSILSFSLTSCQSAMLFYFSFLLQNQFIICLVLGWLSTLSIGTVYFYADDTLEHNLIFLSNPPSLILFISWTTLRTMVVQI